MTAARFEHKFVISHRQREHLLTLWGPRLVRDGHTDNSAFYPILSQYYDTPDLRFCTEKEDGIGMRRKVRIRVYDYGFRVGQAAFFEVKLRHFETVRKIRRRVAQFHPGLLQPLEWSRTPLDGLDVFCALRDGYRLRPAAQVFYMRQAFADGEGSGCRITFDSMLIGLHPGERLSRTTADDASRRILPQTSLILEIKVNGHVPGWVLRGIRQAELQQRSVPKYVLAAQHLRLPSVSKGVHT